MIEHYFLKEFAINLHYDEASIAILYVKKLVLKALQKHK